jgi:DNA-binding IclR family transcriptional regulator
MTSANDVPTADDAEPKRGRRVRSVDHAIDVLETLAAGGRPMGVTDIARRTELSKASVHHMLATLESRRFVMREPESNLYRLGWALYELGAGVVRNLDISRVARPFLDRLAEQTGESVLLGILDEDAVLYLDRGEAPNGLRMTANAGRRGPLHATASGKVLLAFAQDHDLFNRVVGSPLRPLTRTTVTDPSTLRQQIAEVRHTGYATCWQETENGLSSLAVGIRDYTGAVAGSIAVAGPATRLTARTLQAHLVPLQATAHQIEVQLGGAGASATPVMDRNRSVIG